MPGGRSPATSPTHDDASIWNGSHGPTPPVMSADAKRVVEPSTNPKRGAVDAPAEDEQEEHELDPAGARAQRSQGRTDRRQHAEHGERLRVHAPRGHLGEDDGDERRQDQREDVGRVALVGERRPAG